jgi:hypothetical protein
MDSEEQTSLIRLTLLLTTVGAILALFLFFSWLIKGEVAREPEIYVGEAVEEELVVKIKGPLHRQIIFCQDSQDKSHICKRAETITVPQNQETTLDLTGHPLEFGDIIADDVSQGYQQNSFVNVLDYSFVKNCRDLNATAGDSNFDGGCKYADGNLDDNVNNFDIDLIQRTLMEETDDE